VVEQIEMRAHQLDREMPPRGKVIGDHQVAILRAPDDDAGAPLVHAHALLFERDQQRAGVAGNHLVGLQVNVGQVRPVGAPQHLIDG
jgi:hypothetical protein